MTNFYKKYLKYKSKYLKLIGGMDDQEMCDCPCEFVNITTLDGSEYNISLTNPRITMVHQLKERLSKKLGIESKYIDLFIKNTPVREGLLEVYGIINGSELVCVIKPFNINEIKTFKKKILYLMNVDNIKNKEQFINSLKSCEKQLVEKLLEEFEYRSWCEIEDHIRLIQNKPCIGCQNNFDINSLLHHRGDMCQYCEIQICEACEREDDGDYAEHTCGR
jgi:hypothetical protein